MGPEKFKEISEDMIGMDDRLCNCASKVVDLIVSCNENKDAKTSLREIMEALDKSKKNRTKKQAVLK